MARRRTIAAAILLIAFVGVASADLSMTDHLRGWMDAAVSQIGWGSGAASGAQAITHGRSLVEDSSSRAMNINFTPIPAWRGRFDLQYGLSYFAPALVINNCNRNTQSCSNIPGLSYPYYQFLVDPTAPETGKPVMQVWYPAGSWSPTAPTPGGALFYAYPYKNNPSEAADPLSMYGATMEYEVFFPTGFDFVKGGKLPGFGGGEKNGRGCGGGVKPNTCFSYRLMWRRNGAGEAYLYVPQLMQSPELCSGYPPCSGTKVVPCNECGTELGLDAGLSYNRGAFFFQTGVWTRLKLRMVLNFPGNATNGVLQLTVNDNMVMNFDKMNWRQYDNIYIEGATFATWFGGSDVTWAPTVDQHVFFRNFNVYYDGPTDAPARVAAPKQPSGPQVVVNEYIEEGP